MTVCYEPEIIQPCATGIQLKEPIYKPNGLLSANIWKL